MNSLNSVSLAPPLVSFCPSRSSLTWPHDMLSVVSEAIPLFEDLRRAMRRHMLAALPVDPTCTLRDRDFRTLHSIYATWRGRVPTAMPRSVHLSAELLANPERERYADGLAAVVRKIAQGADLRSRMSTAIEHAYDLERPPILARRRSGRAHDRLLADCGIHHLHLFTSPHWTRPEYVKRSRHVLLVAFVGADAYLIDLRAHQSDGANWSELAILDTVVRNWPEAGILRASNYALGLVGGNRSDDDGASSGRRASAAAWSKSMGASGRLAG